MNKTKSIQFILMFALAVGLTLFFPLNQAKAYTCPGPDADTICYTQNDPPRSDCDSDADGLTDAEECDGITLPKDALPVDGVTYQYEAAVSELRLDPKKKDLFLIIVRAEESEFCSSGQPSLLPTDNDFLLYPSTNSPDDLGLGLTVHVINNSQAPDGQKITDGQRAVKMTESCSMADPDVAGEATRTLPTLGAAGIIYTYVIHDKIYSLDCDDGVSCFDASGNPTTKAALFDWHIINTFNHEGGHMLSLSVNRDKKAGYHWPAETGNELDQFVKCDNNRRKRVSTCYIADTHAPPDISGIKLK